ncbi:GtrA family protein [Novosphingobium sp.]|uniref:GtrA family protein n=1 Tax=Novosphingobium sp. TaxID=1874826 RepID=UPI003B51B9A4
MNGYSKVTARPLRDVSALFGPAQMRQFLTGTIARYLSSSIVALGADSALFLMLLQCGVAPAIAAAIGFLFGTIVHWQVSSRVMFAAGVAPAGPERRMQMALFLGSALVGLVLTIGIVGLGAALAIDPRLAKLGAVAVSFVTSSGLRHVLIFGKPQAA